MSPRLLLWAEPSQLNVHDVHPTPPHPYSVHHVRTKAKMPEQEKVLRTVILKKIEDWDNWYMMIRTAAKVTKVWQYINPETPKNEIPTLDKLQEPLFSNVQQGARTMMDLAEVTKRKQFKYLQIKYKDQMDIYAKHELSLDSFNTEIQKSIGKG